MIVDYLMNDMETDSENPYKCKDPECKSQYNELMAQLKKQNMTLGDYISAFPPTTNKRNDLVTGQRKLYEMVNSQSMRKLFFSTFIAKFCIDFPL